MEWHAKRAKKVCSPISKASPCEKSKRTGSIFFSLVSCAYHANEPMINVAFFIQNIYYRLISEKNKV